MLGVQVHTMTQKPAKTQGKCSPFWKTTMFLCASTSIDRPVVPLSASKAPCLIPLTQTPRVWHQSKKRHPEQKTSHLFFASRKKANPRCFFSCFPRPKQNRSFPLHHSHAQLGPRPSTWTPRRASGPAASPRHPAPSPKRPAPRPARAGWCRAPPSGKARHGRRKTHRHGSLFRGPPPQNFLGFPFGWFSL